MKRKNSWAVGPERPRNPATALQDSLSMDRDLESVQEAQSLLQAAHDAWLKFEHFTEEQVERILLEISKAGIANAEPLARMAVEETGFGNAEHKTLKNLFCAQDVYQAIRPMKTVGIVNEDKEKKIFEVASPIGVIAAIIPSTNPRSEEHTSELQSPCNLVCRLLLEKTRHHVPT